MRLTLPPRLPLTLLSWAVLLPLLDTGGAGSACVPHDTRGGAAAGAACDGTQPAYGVADRRTRPAVSGGVGATAAGGLAGLAVCVWGGVGACSRGLGWVGCVCLGGGVWACSSRWHGRGVGPQRTHMQPKPSAVKGRCPAQQAHSSMCEQWWAVSGVNRQALSPCQRVWTQTRRRPNSEGTQFRRNPTQKEGRSPCLPAAGGSFS